MGYLWKQSPTTITLGLPIYANDEFKFPSPPWKRQILWSVTMKDSLWIYPLLYFAVCYRKTPVKKLILSNILFLYQILECIKTNRTKTNNFVVWHLLLLICAMCNRKTRLKWVVANTNWLVSGAAASTRHVCSRCYCNLHLLYFELHLFYAFWGKLSI